MPFGSRTFVAEINFIQPLCRLPVHLPPLARIPEIPARESSNWENTDETGLSFIGLFLTGENATAASRFRGGSRISAAKFTAMHINFNEETAASRYKVGQVHNSFSIKYSNGRATRTYIFCSVRVVRNVSREKRMKKRQL